MESTEQSYQRFLCGDERGLVDLIRAYRDGLILYLNGFVSDLSVAEDLAEDTFLKLVLKKPRFSARSTFKTWLYTIGRNLALDHLRRNKRVHIPLEHCPEVADEELDLERQYLRQEEKIELHRTMKKLKDEYRQILWLIYFEDFSCEEAGKIMGKSVNSIRVLVCRARQALKTKLTEEGFVYENL